MVHFIIFAKYFIKKWFILYEKFGSFMATCGPGPDKSCYDVLVVYRNITTKQTSGSPVVTILEKRRM